MPVADAAPGTVVHRAVVTVETDRPMQIVDLTPLVDAVVERVGLVDGLVAVTTRHTTTGLLVNEHEPLLEADLLAMLERLAPRGAAYAHDDFTRRGGVPPGERVNGHAHCRAVLLRASETLPVAEGRLVLGRWQRVLFVECDGGQRRQVAVTCLGVGRDPRHRWPSRPA
ncbi:MAG: secondary thiamine-phosphate synthase enzyme YjbQ [Vicinamibacterales bacterium]